jgi:hypothetical protein
MVTTVTLFGLFSTPRGTPLPASLAAGDRLTAVANADGNSVDIWKTDAANVTTYLGAVTVTNGAFSGTGRIGLQLPPTATVDDFRGGNAS